MQDDCILVALGLPQLGIIRQKEYGDRFELTVIFRREDAIKKGIDPAALSKSINELLVLKRRLQHRLAEIETERQKALKLPAITEMMVDEVLDQVHSMIDTTDPKELKTALSHFIEKIEVTGSEITIFYSVAPPKKAIVHTNGDPEGI